MNQRSFDPTRFFNSFPRFVETSETGHVLDRLNARYLGLIHEHRELIAGANVLDLASHDGRFSFAALQDGAARVVGIEAEPHMVQKSFANMNHYDVPTSQYEFLRGDMFELIEQVERCDVVFCFGILYHINHHMLLLEQIAERDPRTLIIDTNISSLEAPVIELRNPVHGDHLRLGGSLEGYPSQAALDAMLSSFGWNYEYFDRNQSGLTEPAQMVDYRAGERVTIVVDCDQQGFSKEERERAVQLVLDKQRDRRSRFISIAQ